MQLHYADAAMRPLLCNVPATGIVSYDELRLARIVPRARGRVERIDAVVGEQAQAGQRLAVLELKFTEGALVGDDKRTRQQLMQIRRTRIGVAIHRL
jgi:multidrug efflux pump subunit AcrA (membrane-fusion protein)